MKAHIHDNWAKHGVDLYLYQDYQNTRIPYLLENGRFVFDDSKAVPVGAELPATLFIPHEFYEAIRTAMIGEAIDNDDALADTRRIRDRLLAMVESEWQSKQIMERVND